MQDREKDNIKHIKEIRHIAKKDTKDYLELDITRVIDKKC